MDDEDTCLHGHELVQFGINAVIGGRSRDGRTVNDTDINGLKGVSNGRRNADTIIVVLIDKNNISPAIGLNEGSNWSCLEGALDTSTKEVRNMILINCITCCRGSDDRNLGFVR
jgi:hypothetical protein